MAVLRRRRAQRFCARFARFARFAEYQRPLQNEQQLTSQIRRGGALTPPIGAAVAVTGTVLRSR